MNNFIEYLCFLSFLFFIGFAILTFIFDMKMFCFAFCFLSALSFAWLLIDSVFENRKEK